MDKNNEQLIDQKPMDMQELCFPDMLWLLSEYRRQMSELQRPAQLVHVLRD